MSEAAVHELVDQVKRLSEDERLLFDELVTQLEEEEWAREAETARRSARDQGISMAGYYTLLVDRGLLAAPGDA